MPLDEPPELTSNIYPFNFKTEITNNFKDLPYLLNDVIPKLVLEAAFISLSSSRKFSQVVYLDINYANFDLFLLFFSCPLGACNW